MSSHHRRPPATRRPRRMRVSVSPAQPPVPIRFCEVCEIRWVLCLDGKLFPPDDNGATPQRDARRLRQHGPSRTWPPSAGEPAFSDEVPGAGCKTRWRVNAANLENHTPPPDGRDALAAVLAGGAGSDRWCSGRGADVPCRRRRAERGRPYVNEPGSVLANLYRSGGDWLCWLFPAHWALPDSIHAVHDRAPGCG